MRTRNEILTMVEEKLKPYGRLLFLTKSGSQLYGTNTPESDTDYLGVFIAKPEYHLGFKTIEEVDLSEVVKDSSGKNTKEALDCKVYELKKFLKLAMENNPNLIEILYSYTNSETVVFNTPEFEEFQNKSELFINQRVFHSFMGYAKSQLKKGKNKAVNYKDLISFQKTLEEFLQSHDNNMTLGEVQHYNEFAPFKHLFKKDGVVVSNLSFPRNLFIKKANKMMKEKIATSSHRAAQWKAIGYDAKFFMHLFRLLEEGRDLIVNKKLKFPLENVVELKRIRNLEFTLEELEDRMEVEFANFEKLQDVVKELPKTANLNELEKMFMELLKKEFCNF